MTLGPVLRKILIVSHQYFQFWDVFSQFLVILSPLRPFLSPPGPGPGFDKLEVGSNCRIYVPRACIMKNLESIPPIILVLRHSFLVFGHFEAIQALFSPPLTQARAIISWGSDQNVIVYVPRACTKKNLESIPPMILVSGHIFLVFGHFGVFGFFQDFLGWPRRPQSLQSSVKRPDI